VSDFTHDSITDRCLTYPEEATSIVHKAESDLLKRDKHLTLIEACKHQSPKHVVNIIIAGYKYGTRLWTVAGTIAIQKLIRYLACALPYQF